MVKIKKENLEKAFEKEEQKTQIISKEMELGFHQGALNTLVSERGELIKMIQNVEKIMQAHMKRLEELGVKINPSKR